MRLTDCFYAVLRLLEIAFPSIDRLRARRLPGRSVSGLMERDLAGEGWLRWSEARHEMSSALPRSYAVAAADNLNALSPNEADYTSPFLGVDIACSKPVENIAASVSDNVLMYSLSEIVLLSVS